MAKHVSTKHLGKAKQGFFDVDKEMAYLKVGAPAAGYTDKPVCRSYSIPKRSSKKGIS
jgi:hypothetical protein